jgi:putative ABC transport system permease protein
LGRNQNDIVIVPISTYRNRLGCDAGDKRVGSISVKVKRPKHEIEEETSKTCCIARRLSAATSLSPSTEFDRNLASARKINKVMTMLLAAVAGINLVIGSIGIIEHHAGQRDRAHPRNRSAHGGWRAAKNILF